MFMDAPQQLVILGGLAVCQVIAMTLSYWIGRQAGKAAAAAKSGIVRLSPEESSEPDLMVNHHV